MLSCPPGGRVEGSGPRLLALRFAPAGMTTKTSCLATSRLDDELFGEIVEGPPAGLGDEEGRRDLEAPALLPDAGNAVEGHAGLQHRLVAGAQARRVLAPIRRVCQAEGIADAALLLDAMLGDGPAPGGLDILSG